MIPDNPDFRYLVNSASTLPEYAGWKPEEVGLDIIAAMDSDDNLLKNDLTNALSAIPDYAGWESQEIFNDVNEIFRSSAKIPIPDYAKMAGPAKSTVTPPLLRQEERIPLDFTNYGKDPSEIKPDFEKIRQEDLQSVREEHPVTSVISSFGGAIFPSPDKEKQQIRTATHPVASTVGTGLGMVVPALIPGMGFTKLAQVPKFAAAIAKMGKAGKPIYDAVSRMSITGGDYTARHWDELRSDDPAVRDNATKSLVAAMAAAGVSVAPELLKGGWWQPILQGLTGGAAEIGAQSVIGQNPLSPEAAAQTIFQTALSGIFGLGMVRGAPKPGAGAGKVDFAVEQRQNRASVIPEGWKGDATPEEMGARQVAPQNRAFQEEASRRLADETQHGDAVQARTNAILESQKTQYETMMGGQGQRRGEVEGGLGEAPPVEPGGAFQRQQLIDKMLDRYGMTPPTKKQLMDDFGITKREEAGSLINEAYGGAAKKAIPESQPQQQPQQQIASAPAEPQPMMSGAEGKPQIDLGKYDPQKRAENELSEITDPKVREREIKRRFDRLLGDYGVTKFDELESIQREFDADGISYSLERADGGNLGGLNKHYGGVHTKADEDVKKVWGEIYAIEVRKNGGIIGRDQGDEFIVLWPGKTAKEAYAVHETIDVKIQAKIEELGLSKIKHPKRNNIETGALDVDYGIVDATPGKFGEVDRAADGLAAAMKQKKEIDYYQKNGYIYDEGAKEYVQGKPASPIGDRPEPSSAGSVKNIGKPTGPKPESISQPVPEPVPAAAGTAAAKPAAVSEPTPESRIGVYTPPQPEPSTVKESVSVALEAKTQGEVNQGQARIAETPAGGSKRVTLEDAKPSEEPNPLLMGGVSPTNLPKYVQHFNLDKSPDTDNRLLLAKQAEQYAPTIQRARDVPVRHWDEVVRLSKQTGVLANGINRRVGKALSDRELRAVNDHLEQVTTDYKNVLKSFNDKRGKGEVTENDRVALAELANYHGFVLAQATGANSEAGRALAILRQIRNAKNQAESLADLSEQIKNGGFSDEDITKIVAFVEKSKDPSAINKVSWYKKSINSLYELWLNWGLLSNPVTHSANITSNAFTSFIRTVAEKPAATFVDPLIARFQKRKTERFLGEIFPEAQGQLAAITNVFGAGKAGFDQGGIKTMIRAIGQEFDQVQSMFGGKIEYPAQVKGVPGQIIRAPGNALQAEDLVFKKIVYEGEVLSRIYRQVRSEGLKGATLKQRSQELVKKVADPATKDKVAAQIRRVSMQEAEYRTYTQALGKIGRDIMRLRNAIPGARFIVPFIRTPLNILKYGLERLPGTGEFILAKRMKSGEIKGAEVSDQVGKLIVGHLMSIPIVLIARAGLITGAGPKDRNERKALEATGWQPYEIKIGDKWYSYRRLERLATVLGTSADFVEIANATKDEDKISGAAAQLAGSIAKNITSKTFTEQAAQFYSALQDPERYGTGFVKRFATSLVPGAARGVAHSMDPRYRAKETLGEYVQSVIPGKSQDLPPKRDVLGKEIEKEGGFLWNFVVPIRVRKDETNSILAEINRLRVPLSMPTKKIYGQELTTKQFDEYGKISGEKTYERLEKLINSPAYQNMNDYLRTEWIKKKVNEGRDHARKVLSGKYKLEAISRIDEALDRRGITGEEKQEQRATYLQKLGITIEDDKDHINYEE